MSTENSLRVLYLEDNLQDADLTRRELSRRAPTMNLEIVTSLAAARARLAAPGPPFDVVLADLRLPDGSGLELLAEIRKQELPLAVVILTGSGDQEAAVAALKAGADDYLVKIAQHSKQLPKLIEEAHQRFQSQHQRRLHPLRVLYAEPNSFDADLTRRHLARQAPYIQLQVVGSGEEVLELLGATEKPPVCDMLLLDYRLPGLNALEVVKFLRQECGSPVPIVLVTGQGTEEVAVQALRLGVDDYLVKREGYLHRLPVVLENVQKQNQLNRAETRYRNLFASLRDVVIIADSNRIILDANQPALRTLFGYENDEIVSRPTAILYASPEEFERAGKEAFNRPDAAGGKLLEVQFRRKSGEVFTAELFALKLCDDHGQPTGNIGVIRDITERKQTEQRRREILRARADIMEYAINHPLDELLTLVLDRVGELVESPIGFYHFVEADGQTLILQQWSSRTLKEFCRAESKNLHYPIHQAGVWADCVRRKEAVIHNDYEALEGKRGLPAGHAKVVRELVVPVLREDMVVAVLGVGNKPSNYTGRDLEIISYLADITWEAIDSLKSREALRRSEIENERLLAAIEQADESIMITDPAGIIQYVNPCFERITGYGRKEALGRTPAILKSGKQDAAFYKHLWKTITSGGTYSGRVINRRKDGTLYTEELTISPVVNSAGRIINYVAVKKDITEALQMEAKLRQAQKMEAIGTLAGGIAHDFNNILSAILGYAQLADDSLDNPAQAREDLVQVVTAGKRAVDLVRQILTIARQADRQQQPLRIQFLVKEALKLLRPSISTAIGIETDIDPNTPEILADPGEIHQLIMNLCVNAHHAMQEVRKNDHLMKIVLRPVDLDEAMIARSGLAVAPGRYAALTVSDTGCGMTLETMEKIFEPYFTTKAKGKGTGLGLAMVKSVVEEVGGAVRVESVVGRGADFTVYLPVHVGEKAAGYSTAAKEIVRGGPERIMVIDDEELLVRLHERTLARHGYRVSTFTDCAEAMQAFMADPTAWDLIITDLNMPKTTGLDLARACLQVRSEVPVILCTGFSEEIDREQAKALGMTEMLYKPVDATILLRLVREILDRQKTRT
ncbi:MAG: response regulator [Thermodesulfobacteriota bacterium]